MKSDKGFSLIELMVVIAIIAIVVAVAAPSYESMMAGSRLTSSSNTLVGALRLARSEAVTSKQNVFVCSSDDQATCAGSWANGGVVRRADGQVIRVLSAFPAGITVAGATIQYGANGQLAAAANLSVNNGTDTTTVQVNRIGQTSICHGSC